jgi:hypothetical protein
MANWAILHVFPCPPYIPILHTIATLERSDLPEDHFDFDTMKGSVSTFSHRVMRPGSSAMIGTNTFKGVKDQKADHAAVIIRDRRGLLTAVDIQRGGALIQGNADIDAAFPDAVLEYPR